MKNIIYGSLMDFLKHDRNINDILLISSVLEHLV